MSNTEDTIEQDGASNGDSEADFQSPRTHVDRYERIELPPFWSQQAQLWFAAVEAQFQLRRITSDATKYYTVIARLDQDALIVVENLITNPPTNDKYSTLKNALLNHFALSQSRRFKMLLSGVELGDRRPSELLAEINRLGGDKLDPAFVRVIWLERLPPQVQMALVGRDQEDNVQLSQLANQIMEVQRNAN
ncbi:uncharacterized protein LOC128869961 [Anastrepha ludens]|uniref:uncharacterized protein LOC128869961 n=1 Tax=Anastrepha ludens TaxID=28586 RepID=UPI0023B16CD9|nr:uncharacterized protein LOC128869961 [Anastrepha ludens]